MNLKYIVLAGCLYSSWAMAQDVKESQVPKAVVDGFKSKYPGTFVYEWELKKKEKRYEAEFMEKGIKHDASFGLGGEWLWTSREIEKESLPQAVSSSLSRSEYAGWDIDDVEERQSPAGLTYSMEAESGKRELILYFLADGTLDRTVKK